MKQLTKLLTTLLSLAMMFCVSSCTEEEIADLDLPVVDASTITSVLAGDGRAQVQWTVVNDENVTTTAVSFVDASENEVLRETFDVTPGQEMSKEFTLDAGTYTVVVANGGLTTGIVSSWATATVTVYDSSAYALPTMEVDVVSNIATLSWDSVDGDCQGVEVTYVDAEGATKTTERTEIHKYLPTTISSLQTGDSEISFVAYFRPTDGLDEVSLESAPVQVTVVPSVAASTITSLQAGNGRAVLDWTVVDDANVTTSVVKITNAEGTVVDSVAYSVAAAQTMSKEYTLVAGEYTFELSNAGDLDIDSSVATSKVTVYDGSEYTLPVATVETETGQAVITWTEVDADLLYVDITYTNVSGEEVTAEKVVVSTYAPLTLSVKAGTTSYSYKAYFMPLNGLDEIVKESATDLEISLVPSVPASTISSVYPGNGRAQMRWTVVNNDNVTTSIVKITNAEGTVVDSVAYAVTAGSIMSKEYDKLAAGTYTFELANAGESDLASSVATATATVYDAKTYDAKPTFTVATDSVTAEVSITWGTIPTDLTAVAITYTDTTEAERTLSVTPTEGDVTLLTKAKNGVDIISIVSSFCPEFGLDVIELTYDETVSIPAVEVSAPSSVTASAGNERAVVSWAVAADSGVVGSVVTYTISDGTPVASETISVIMGETAEYELTSLAVGTYSITVYNVLSTGAISSEVAASDIVVYDAATYSTQPTIGEVTLDNATGYVSIPWTNVAADCTGISLVYTNSSSANATLALTVASGDVTVLEDAKDGVDIVSIISSFCPEGGLDVISLTYDATVSIPVRSVMSPMSVTATAGAEKIYVTWLVSPDSDTESALIRCTSTEGTSYDFAPTTLKLGATNTYSATDLPVGTYSVAVYNVFADATMSDPFTIEGVVVYDSTAFEYPEYTVNTSTGKAVFTWTSVPADCTGFSYTYTDEDRDSQTVAQATLSVGDVTSIAAASGTSTVYFTFYFQPEGGYDEATKTSEVAVLCTPTVDASTINSLLAGDGRLQLEWTVVDSEFINQSIVTIIDADSTVVSTQTYDVVRNTPYVQEYALAAGTYTVSVENASTQTTMLSTAATATATVYSVADYALPTATVDASTGVAIITWGSVDAACTGVKVTYVNLSGETTTTDLLAIADDATTTLEVPVGTTTYSYEAYFCPTDGLDTVSIASATDLEITTSLYVAPSTITSAAGGNGRAVVEWTVVDSDYVLQNTVTITDATGAVVSNETYDVTASAAMSKEYTLAAGAYTVSILNVGTASFNTEAATATVTVYDATAYSLPTVSTYSDGTDVIFTLEATSDLQSVTVTYNGAEVPLTSTATVAYSASSYTYTATYLPEGGLDEIVVSGGAGTISIESVSPDVVAMSAVPGDMKLQVSWDAGRDSDVAGAIITYTSATGVANTQTVSSVTESGNVATIDVTESGKYSVSVQNANADGTGVGTTLAVSDVEVYSLDALKASKEEAGSIVGALQYSLSAAAIQLPLSTDDRTALSFTYVDAAGDSQTVTDATTAVNGVGVSTIRLGVLLSASYSYTATYPVGIDGALDSGYEVSFSGSVEVQEIDKSKMSQYPMLGESVPNVTAGVNDGVLADFIDGVVAATADGYPDYAPTIAFTTTTIDLGAKYIVTGYSHWTSLAAVWGNGMPKEAHLYATDSDDPANDEALNCMSSTTLPDLTAWTYLTGGTYAKPNTIDFDSNGDGTVDANDNDYTFYTTGMCNNYDGVTNVAARYVKFQLGKNFNAGASTRNQELTLWGFPVVE